MTNAEGLSEKAEKKVMDIDASAVLLLGWWDKPEDDGSKPFAEVMFISAGGRSFRKTILRAARLTDFKQAKTFLSDGVQTAGKFFGEIVEIRISGGEFKEAESPKFNGYRPWLKANVAPAEPGVPAPNRTFAPKYKPEGISRLKRLDISLFKDLPKTPDNLKKFALERLRTRRAIFVQSGELELRDAQIDSLDKIELFLAEENDNLAGYIVQPTGAGKTVLFGILLKLIDLPGLILVPDSNLLEQIKEELVKTLKFNPNEIGLLDKTHREFGRKFILATYSIHNSLLRRGNPNYKRQLESVGVMICDEAHDAVGEKTTERIKIAEGEEFKKCIRVGFTATPQLINKHIRDYFGQEISTAKFSEQVKKGVLVPLKLIEIGARLFSKEVKNAVISEEDENNIVNREQLFERTLEEYQQLRQKVEASGGRLVTAVYVNRIAHAYRYQQMAIEKAGYKSSVVVSGHNNESAEDQRARVKRIEKRLVAGEEDMVIAVGKLAQGWDFKPLNCVILAAPMASPKKITQRVGRGARALEGKDCCYVIAPNYKIIKPRKVAPDHVPREIAEPLIRAKPAENKTYKLGDQISVLSSLKEFGESDEDLQGFCEVVKRNAGTEEEMVLEKPKKKHRMLRQIVPGAPMEYFEDYFEDLERMRADLENLAKNRGLEDISLIRSRHFGEADMILTNGQKLSGEDFLNIATQLLFNNAAARYKGLWEMKRLLGVTLPELTDAAYYTPQRVRADFRLAKKSAFPDDGYRFFCASDFYRSDERVIGGSAYLQKAHLALQMPDITMKKVYQRLVWIAAQEGNEAPVVMAPIIWTPPAPAEEKVAVEEPAVVVAEEVKTEEPKVALIEVDPELEPVVMAEPEPDPEPAIVVVAQVIEEVEVCLEGGGEPAEEVTTESGGLTRNRWDLSNKRLRGDFKDFADRYDVPVGLIDFAEMSEWKFKTAKMGEVTLREYLLSFQKLIDEEFLSILDEQEILAFMRRLLFIRPLESKSMVRTTDRVYLSYYKQNGGRNVYCDLKTIALLVGVEDFRKLRLGMFDERQFFCSSGSTTFLDNYLELAGAKLHTGTKAETLRRLVSIAEEYYNLPL